MLPPGDVMLVYVGLGGGVVVAPPSVGPKSTAVYSGTGSDVLCS